MWVKTREWRHSWIMESVSPRLSINKCDLLSYHQGTLKVSMFIPNTDPKSASRPCWHKVMTLNGVKVNVQNTVMIN